MNNPYLDDASKNVREWAPRDMFGADAMSFTQTKHLGSNRARLSQIINGKRTPVTDHITE